MDARGFGARECRTLARPRSFARGDLALVVSAAAVVAVATASSVALGTWRPLLAF
jgi:energy-coupling factor transport system permease protein